MSLNRLAKIRLWVLSDRQKSYIRPKINMILSKSVFISLSDCLSTLEALLSCRTEPRLAKAGGREENVRAFGLVGGILRF